MVELPATIKGRLREDTGEHWSFVVGTQTNTQKNIWDDLKEPTMTYTDDTEVD